MSEVILLRVDPRLMILVTCGDMERVTGVVLSVMIRQARVAMPHPAFCGVPEQFLGELVAQGSGKVVDHAARRRLMGRCEVPPSFGRR